MIKIFVPKDAYLGDVLEFLAAANTPIRGVTTYTDGWDINVQVAPVEQGRILSKATSRNLVVGGRQHKPVPAENVGVFGEYDLESLMKENVDTILVFVAAHQDELGIKDFQDMLVWEEAHKKRSTIIRGLQALIGE
jgi:hypothetical protein